jgi:hypothetical protein
MTTAAETARLPAPAKLARVLFDEAHSEAWTIRPEVARALQPNHPGDSSLAAAAAALAEREFDVAAHTGGGLLYTSPSPRDRG